MNYFYPLLVISCGTTLALSAATSSLAQSAQSASSTKVEPLAKTVLPSKVKASSIATTIIATAPATTTVATATVATGTTAPATPLPPDRAKPEAQPSAPPSKIPPAKPAPGSTSPLPAPGTSGTQAAGLQPVQVPEYLNPSPNPLQFPTTPEEVSLKGVQPISLEQALELARRNNRGLQQARLQKQRSEASLREAEAGKFPTIFVQGDFGRSKSAATEITNRRRIDAAQDAVEEAERNASGPNDFLLRQAQQDEERIRLQARDADDPTTQINVALNVNYDLFTSGGRENQIKAAKKQVRLSELETERIESQLYFDVANDYYDLQDADEQVQIAAASVASARSNLKDAAAQFEAGLGTKFDVLRAEVQLANNQQQLTSNVATREIRRRQIAQRLSLPETVGMIAADPVVQAGKWPLTLEQSIILAYKNRAELEQQLVQRDISEARRKVALAALGPTVSLNGQLNFLDIFEQSITTIGSGYSIGVQARWTLFDGGLARARADQQTKDKEIAESRFAEAKNTVRFEVERAYSTLLANQANIVTTEKAVAQADEALRLAILRFQAGVGTQTDRINAEADLTRARGNRTSAVIGYNRSLAQLRRAVSNLTNDSSRSNLSTTK